VISFSEAKRQLLLHLVGKIWSGMYGLGVGWFLGGFLGFSGLMDPGF
jgi:hypothetical protein